MSERPLECSECKKPIKVCYTEIIGETIIRTSMCADCPELQKRLHGIPSGTVSSLGGAALSCGGCGTTLDSIRQGGALGCSECYEVFGDILVAEMIPLTKRIASGKKNALIHRGRAPGETAEMNPALRLLALNDALNETLTREDYEQAAYLRDQIKALMEKQENDGKK